jgi:anaerobic magnesium-protoporphyrin IX monomethyl ester cyclase
MADRSEHPADAWVALVGPEVEENLSLRYLASSLEHAGIVTEILPFNVGVDLRAILQVICSDPQPTVVGLSLSFQWRAQDVLALAMALRQNGYRGHITAGGHFGSFAWQQVLQDFSEIDSICRFEAEDTLRELCLAVLQGRDPHGLSGMAVRDVQGCPQLTPSRPPPAIDRLPWPDRRGPAARCLGHPIAAMVSSRGCYGNCAFCCIAALHRNSSPAQRHRLRPVDDVAEEMAHLQRERGTDIFIFHDDNFFLPSREDSLQRVQALGEALRARNVTRFATVVKARPNDVTLPVFSAMRQHLQLVRLFLGVESSTQQGCDTLNRGVREGEANRALRVLESLDLYVCFNMLVFDPDASIDALLQNMAFMKANGQHSSNFGRVELYAGTPLLARLQREQRAVGDYLAWDYNQATEPMQRVFELSMEAFRERNFSGRALANRLQSTRFDAEIARHFHADRFRPEWLQRAKELSQRLTDSSAQGVRRIVAYVQDGAESNLDERRFVQQVSGELRECEAAIEALAFQLEHEVCREVGAACDHAPIKGIPIPRDAAALPRLQASVAGCGVAT